MRTAIRWRSRQSCRCRSRPRSMHCCTGSTANVPAADASLSNPSLLAAAPLQSTCRGLVAAGRPLPVYFEANVQRIGPTSATCKPTKIAAVIPTSAACLRAHDTPFCVTDVPPEDFPRHLSVDVGLIMHIRRCPPPPAGGPRRFLRPHCPTSVSWRKHELQSVDIPPHVLCIKDASKLSWAGRHRIGRLSGAQIATSPAGKQPLDIKGVSP